MATIDILLATYNGANFLKIQLDSIISQTFTDWKLLIHDDGSTDNTPQILRDYANKDSRISIIEDNITGLGPGKNFWHLHNFVDAPFVCYCDQDDYWFPDNLSTKYSYIKELDNTKPQLLCFNGYTWFSDENNKIGALCTHFYSNYSFRSALFKNGGLQGCSMILNRVFFNSVNYPIEKVWMHDQILTFFAICLNCLKTYNIPLFLYRQHSDNVTGHPLQSTLDLFKTKKLFSHIPVVEKESYMAILTFFDICQHLIPEKEHTLFNIFEKFPNYTLLKRIYFTIKYRFSNKGSTLNLIIKQICRKNYIS